MKENEVITMQSLFHFMKIFRLFDNKADMYDCLQRLEDTIKMPIDDTLNEHNGINFAQFLEVILRTAYYKVEEEGRAQDENAYEEILTGIFKNALLYINQKTDSDGLFAELFSREVQNIVYDNHALLSGIFWKSATEDNHLSLKMSKEEFIHILSQGKEDEAIIPAEKGQDEEKKEKEKSKKSKKDKQAEEEEPEVIKFKVDDAIAALNEIDLLDTGDEDGKCITYVDFIDALLRVASSYPFGDKESEYPNLKSRL